MNILVTGASGFMGRALCARLEADGHELTRLNSKACDLTDTQSLLQFSQFCYDEIYHLAAWTQAGDFCLFHPGEQWIINQQINTNVLWWWKKSQPQAKMIAIGTSCSYAPQLPHREENYLIGEPIESLFTYAMTKRMLLIGLKSLHSQFNLRYLYVVPSTLYGPFYHTDNRQMHFIFDLIRKILKAKDTNVQPALWGDGHQRRELVFIDDFIQMVLKLNETVENDIINIGSGEEYSIREFCHEICEIIGYEENLIQYDTSRYVGALSKHLVVEKLNSILPDFPRTSLKEGLRATIQWFNESKIQ
jgi:GDP-L-fucose synthase